MTVSCGPYVVSKITQMPPKVINAIFKAFKKELDSDLGPDQKHITVREDGQVGVDAASVEVCLNKLGYEVEWAELPEDRTLKSIADDIDITDQWVIIWLQDEDNTPAHCAAIRKNRVYCTLSPGLLPEAHPQADRRVYMIGFVTQKDDEQEDEPDDSDFQELAA